MARPSCSARPPRDDRDRRDRRRLGHDPDRPDSRCRASGSAPRVGSASTPICRPPDMRRSSTRNVASSSELNIGRPRRRRRPRHQDRPALRAAARARVARGAAAPARPQRASHRPRKSCARRSTSCRTRRRPTGRRSPSGSATCPAASTATSRRCGRASPQGVVPARRQVAEVAEQARKHADPLGFFFDFTGAAKLEDGGGDPRRRWRPTCAKGAEASAAAYAELADFLETELAPAAGEEDAVGRELYALQSRHFLGADDRPRRDLRVGHRRAAAHGRRADAHRGRDQARRIGRRGDRVPRPDASRKLQRHRRTAGLDAGAERQGRRRARVAATSTSPTRSRSSNA